MIAALKRWDWPTWWKVAVAATVLNFLVLAVGFYADVSVPYARVLFTILARSYDLALLLWLGSLAGALYAWHVRK